MATQRRTLTIAEALAWRENWNDADRRFIREHSERLNVARFETSPQGDYLHAKDAAGRTRMYINAGYVEFLAGTEPQGARYETGRPPYVTLSNYQSSPYTKPAYEVAYRECPKHPGMALPASGVCDDCA